MPLNSQGKTKIKINGLFHTARNIYSLSQLKLARYLEWFYNFVIRNLAPLENDIQNLIGLLLVLLPWANCSQKGSEVFQASRQVCLWFLWCPLGNNWFFVHWKQLSLSCKFMQVQRYGSSRFTFLFWGPVLTPHLVLSNCLQRSEYWK